MTTIDSIELASVTGGQSLADNIRIAAEQAAIATTQQYMPCISDRHAEAVGRLLGVAPLPAVDGRREVIVQAARNLKRDLATCRGDDALAPP